MIIINTTTLEDYIEVIKWAVDQNMRWCDGCRSIYEQHWKIFGSETCIIIKNGILSYCRREFIINRSKTNILSMVQFHKNTWKYYINEFGSKFDLK